MYKIEISYKESLAYRNFDDFMNAIGLLMHGGKRQMTIEQVPEEGDEDEEV